MNDLAKFADLLNKCFFTTGQVIEDIRKLYISIEGKDNGKEKKKEAILYELSTGINKYNPNIQLSPSVDFFKINQQLENGKTAHIPYWVRAYIACNHIASELGLKECFQFIAVSIEDIDINKSKEGEKAYSVLIDKTGKAISLKEFGSHVEDESDVPNRTFAKMFYDMASYAEKKDQVAIGSYWSVRVTESGSQQGSDYSENWLELRLVKEDGSYKSLGEMCIPGKPFPNEHHDSIEQFVKWWCWGKSDSNLSLNAPCPQISSYTNKIREYFQEDAKVKPIDGLICLSPFWASSKDDDGVIASIYWAFSATLTTDQIKIIQALTQMLIGGVTPVVKQTLMDKQRRNDLERAEEMLNLLEEPLRKLSKTLVATQEHSQELRAILYDPSHAIFSVAPRVMRFFEDGADVVIGRVRWKGMHNYLSADPENIKLTLGAIICEIFGKMEPEPESSGELIRRAEVVLRENKPGFAHLRKTCLDILSSKVLFLLHDVVKSDSDENKELQRAVGRFKQILHRPYKYMESKFPFDPLFVSLFGVDSEPKISVCYYSEKIEFYKLEDCMQWKLLLEKTAESQANPEANLFPKPLRPPVPLYSQWLALLLGVIAHAKSEKSATVKSAKICVTTQCMSVKVEFSTDIYESEGVKSLYEEMNKRQGDRDIPFYAKGNFHKPFIDFVRIVDVDKKEWNTKESGFTIKHPTSDGKYLNTSIAVSGKYFSYGCELDGDENTRCGCQYSETSSKQITSDIQSPACAVQSATSSNVENSVDYVYFNHTDDAEKITRFFGTIHNLSRLNCLPTFEGGKFKRKIDGTESLVDGKLVCFVHPQDINAWIELCKKDLEKIAVYFVSRAEMVYSEFPENAMVFAEKFDDVDEEKLNRLWNTLIK